MPRQSKNPKQALMKKQIELITCRLMEINLIVDDYVYKCIPISTCNAENCITEIEGYKDICIDDRRCMQVIEKLIRCMKGIIEEQVEYQNLNGNAASVEVENIDEDLTQIPREIDAIDAAVREIDENVKRSNCILSSGQIILNENLPIDLTVYSKDKPTVLGNKNQDVDMLHRAISELSIHDNNNLSIDNKNLEQFSQSVLTDFDVNDNMPVNNKYSEIQQAHNVKVLENFSSVSQSNKALVTKSTDFEDTIAVNIISNEIDKSDSKSPNIDQINRRRKLLNLTSLANNIADVRTTEFTADSYQEINKVPIRKERKPRKITKRNNKDTAKNNKQTRKTKKTNEKDKYKITERKPRKPRKDKNQTRKKSTENNKNNPVQDTETPDKHLNNDMLHNSNHIDVKATKNVLEISNTRISNDACQSPNLHPAINANVSFNPCKENNTSIEKPINYNMEIENDLSWIENMRFVREISSEETIPSFHDDTFWNNYMLPDDWNDSEFL